MIDLVHWNQPLAYDQLQTSTDGILYLLKRIAQTLWRDRSHWIQSISKVAFIRVLYLFWCYLVSSKEVERFVSLFWSVISRSTKGLKSSGAIFLWLQFPPKNNVGCLEKLKPRKTASEIFRPLKVRKSWNYFFKWTFPPKNERTSSTLLLWNLRSTCFRSFFGRNWRHQKDGSKLIDL